jgi:hypothetical protein
MLKADFGYLPEPQDFTEGDITVATLPRLDQTRKNINAHPSVDGAWLYAPSHELRDMFSGAVTKKPYPGRIFGLPKTHSLQHATASDPEHLAFLVWMFGFLKGIRLTTDDMGFLDATPIRTETLTDFGFFGHGEQQALGYADDFWRKRGASAAKGLSAVVHALFLSHQPKLLEFEGIHYAYVALDACHAVWSVANGRNPRKRKHSERIITLCKDLGATAPAWIQDVVDARNDALHEALFFGEPLGFTVYKPQARTGQNIVLEMQSLVARLVCAILTLPFTDYIVSPVDSVYLGKRGLKFPASATSTASPSPPAAPGREA